MIFTEENSNLLESNLYRELQNGKSSEYIIEKYVLHNLPYFFNDNMDLFFDIKKRISNKFSVPITNIYLVGSGQFGFSLSPLKNYSNFRFIEDEENDIKASDLDFAIISSKLFNEFWDKVCDYRLSEIAHDRNQEKSFGEFRKYLFKGWIRPDKFPFNFQEKQDWFEFFNTLNCYVNRQVTCGIFRNEESFVKIYKRNIEELNKRTREII